MSFDRVLIHDTFTIIKPGRSAGLGSELPGGRALHPGGRTARRIESGCEAAFYEGFFPNPPEEVLGVSFTTSLC